MLNISCFGWFPFEPKFIFVCFEDTLASSLQCFWNHQRKFVELQKGKKSLASSLKTVSFSERMSRGRRRMWRSRGRRMRSQHKGLCSHPCPDKGLHVLSANQETILQHILSVFVVVTKFYGL
jgi:hypothetical protein